MDNKVISDQELSEILKQKIDDLKARIAFHQEVVDGLEVQLDRAEEAYEAFAPKPVDSKKNDSDENPFATKLTTAMKAENAIRDADDFLPTAEIVKAINEKYPDQRVQVDSFNAQWPAISKDPNRPFVRIHYNISPNETRYLYGLKNWITNDGLVSRYFKKIQQRVPNTTIFWEGKKTTS